MENQVNHPKLLLSLFSFFNAFGIRLDEGSRHWVLHIDLNGNNWVIYRASRASFVMFGTVL